MTKINFVPEYPVSTSNTTSKQPSNSKHSRFSNTAGISLKTIAIEVLPEEPVRITYYSGHFDPYTGIIGSTFTFE